MTTHQNRPRPPGSAQQGATGDLIYISDIRVRLIHTILREREMSDVAMIEETLARLASYGASAVVHTQEGIPIRSTLDQADDDTEIRPSLVPKLANLSARLFHTACDAAKTAARTTRGDKGDKGKRDGEREKPNSHTVDSIRIRTTTPQGTTAEVIIMNGDCRPKPIGGTTADPPLLVTVIQDCS